MRVPPCKARPRTVWPSPGTLTAPVSGDIRGSGRCSVGAGACSRLTASAKTGSSGSRTFWTPVRLVPSRGCDPAPCRPGAQSSTTTATPVRSRGGFVLAPSGGEDYRAEQPHAVSSAAALSVDRGRGSLVQPVSSRRTSRVASGLRESRGGGPSGPPPRSAPTRDCVCYFDDRVILTDATRPVVPPFRYVLKE